MYSMYRVGIYVLYVGLEYMLIYVGLEYIWHIEGGNRCIIWRVEIDVS